MFVVFGPRPTPGGAIMPCEVADDRQTTLDLGDGPAPERKPRARLCPRCGRGPLTGGKCGWCRGTGSSGDQRAVSKLTSRALNQENREK